MGNNELDLTRTITMMVLDQTPMHRYEFTVRNFIDPNIIYAIYGKTHNDKNEDVYFIRDPNDKNCILEYRHRDEFIISLCKGIYDILYEEAIPYKFEGGLL